MRETNVKIEKYIVHILDNNVQLPVLSEQEHPADSEINDFIAKHIEKVLKDDSLKDAHFMDGENQFRQWCENIVQQKERFTAITADMAVMLFDIMLKHVDIPPADVIFCLFCSDNTLYLGMLKFNYKTSYIHFVQASETGRLNAIIKQKTTLPRENQKLEECVLVNLDDFSVRLIEKKYDINGEKKFYLSPMFLKCTSKISNREKIKIFTKATEQFKKEYFEDDVYKAGEIKKAVTESVNRNERIDIVDVAESVFRQNPEIKNAYLEKIEQAGLRDKTIMVSEKVVEKKFKKQKIKTDTGIEIDLPVEYYHDKEKIEFVNNVDGTISIIIKNIGKISDK